MRQSKSPRCLRCGAESAWIDGRVPKVVEADLLLQETITKLEAVVAKYKEALTIALHACDVAEEVMIDSVDHVLPEARWEELKDEVLAAHDANRALQKIISGEDHAEKPKS